MALPDSPRSSRRRHVASAVREAYGIPPRDRLPLSREFLGDRRLDAPDDIPTIELKAPTWHPHLFRKRLGAWDPRAKHGDLVRVVLSDGSTHGYGLFNPRAEITVRLLNRSDTVPCADWWTTRLNSAVSLRRELLKLDQASDAFRIIHAEADGLSGLVVDRIGTILSAEVFSLGMWQRRKAILEALQRITETEHVVLQPGPRTVEFEGFEGGLELSPGCPNQVAVTEHGVRFLVDFTTGHKTGFFCDQRDNRRLIGTFAAGRSLLDLCCYTGGFALAAKQGGATDVVGVDLDEKAIEVAKRNAKLNRTNIRFSHSDAFPYMRDLQRNEQQFGLVVLDPPKLIATRADFEDGRKRYFDLNRLAMPLVEPGGLMLTCSCSGLMPAEEFQKTVSAAAPPGRRVQILESRGAAPDHPVGTDCPETSYLKALWLRIE